MDAQMRDSGVAANEDVRINTMNAYRGVPVGLGAEVDNQGYKQIQDRYRQRCMGQRIFAVEVDGVPGIGLGLVEVEEGDVVVCGEKGGLVVLREKKHEEGDEEGVFWVVVGKCEVMGFESKTYLEGRDESLLEEFLVV